MRTRILTAVALATLLLTSASASASTRAVLATGDVYFVEAGRYGDLFPEGAEADADAAVLAVNVLRGDGSGARLLVPGTEDPGSESAATLVAGPRGAAVYLLWEAETETSRLQLLRLAEDGWGEAVDVSRGSDVLAGSSRVVATRDRSLAGEESESAVRHRTVLHVAWVEAASASGAGVPETVYAPVVIEDGTYLGDHAQFELSRFAPAVAEGETPQAPAADVRAVLALEPGQEGSAVVAFTDPDSGRLVSLDLRPVAGELSEIGDQVRDGILDQILELEPGDPESLSRLADGARAHLVNVGRQLRPAVLGILAAELHTYIREAGTDWGFQPNVMATRTRAHLIAVGASFDHTSISNLHGGARPHLVNVGHHLEGPDRSHDLSVRVAVALPPPEMPPEAITSVYLSASGHEALVAWEEDGLVVYRESDGQAWGEPVTLGVEASADAGLIDSLLSERVRSH